MYDHDHGNPESLDNFNSAATRCILCDAGQVAELESKNLQCMPCTVRPLAARPCGHCARLIDPAPFAN